MAIQYETEGFLLPPMSLKDEKPPEPPKTGFSHEGFVNRIRVSEEGKGQSPKRL